MRDNKLKTSAFSISLYNVYDEGQIVETSTQKDGRLEMRWGSATSERGAAPYERDLYF